MRTMQPPAGIIRFSRRQLNVAYIDPLSAQLADFCAVLRGDAEPVVSGEEGYKTLAVTLAVAESARRNMAGIDRWLLVTEFLQP